MNLNKIFRVCMALLVVCCLLINVSPVRAHAAAVTIATVRIAATIVVGSVLIGLGLLPDVDTSVFTDTVNSIISTLNLTETIQLTTWIASGFQKYAVPDNLIESIRAYVFDAALVFYNPPVNGVALGAGETIQVSIYDSFTTTGYCEVFCAQNIYSGKGNFLFLSTNPFSVNGTASTAYGRFQYIYFSGISCGSWDSAGYYKFPYSPYGAQNATTFANSCTAYYQGATFVAEDGFVAGTIAEESADFKTGYETWYIEGVHLYQWSDGSYHHEPEPDNDNDPIPFIPVGIGQTYEETISNSQSKVQSGESTYVDSSQDTSTGVGGVTSSISQTWLGQKLDSIVSSISGFFSDVISTIKAIPDAFTTCFEDILTGLETLGQTILEGIQAIFVPSTDFVTAKVEALRARFDFINVFMDFIDSFKGQFSGGTPPVIYVHLENAEGSYNYGGTVKFLDMSWYSRYKGTGDALISGFLWALFGWRMYLKLPGIINGVSGGVGSMSSRFKRDGD